MLWIVIALVIVVLVVLLLVTQRLSRTQQVEGRLADHADAGTGHGSHAADVAPTGAPADAGAEDMRALTGDATPGAPLP